jgi:hypothetical protein
MSRQTSLQRADQKSPECHHPFPVVEIHPESKAGSDVKSTPSKKPPLGGDPPAMPKINLKNQG